MTCNKVVYVERDKSTDSLAGGVLGLISHLQGVINTLPKEWADSCCIDFDVEEYYDSHSSVFSLYYTRPETKEEGELRIKVEETKAEKIRERDLIQLAQIQKRLGII